MGERLASHRGGGWTTACGSPLPAPSAVFVLLEVVAAACPISCFFGRRAPRGGGDGPGGSVGGAPSVDAPPGRGGGAPLLLPLQAAMVYRGGRDYSFYSLSRPTATSRLGACVHTVPSCLDFPPHDRA